MHDSCLSDRRLYATMSTSPRPTILSRLRHQLSLFRRKDATNRHDTSERLSPLSRLDPFTRRKYSTLDRDHTVTTTVPSARLAATISSFSKALSAHSPMVQAKPRRASIAVDPDHSWQASAQSTSPKAHITSKHRTSKRDVEREEFASITTEQSAAKEVLISTREFWHHRDTEHCTGPPQVWHTTLQLFDSSSVSDGPSVVQKGDHNAIRPARTHDKRRRLKHMHAPKRRGAAHSKAATVGSNSERPTPLKRSRISERKLVGNDVQSKTICVNGHPPQGLRFSADLHKDKGFDDTHSFHGVGGRLQDRTRPVSEGNGSAPKSGHQSHDKSAQFQGVGHGYVSHARSSLSQVPSPPGDSRAGSDSTRDSNSGDWIRSKFGYTRGRTVQSTVMRRNMKMNRRQRSNTGQTSSLPSFQAAKSRAWKCVSSNLARLGMAGRFLDPWPGDRKRRLLAPWSKMSESVAERFSLGNNGVNDDDYIVDDFA